MAQQEGVNLQVTDREWEPPLPASHESIWRYMDFRQFISLIQREELWFARLDQFFDSYEGVPPNKMRASIRDRLENSPINIPVDKATMGVMNMFKAAQLSTFVNCWHHSNNESAAMWGIYDNRGKEIAIKTNVLNLMDSIQGNYDDLKYGKVTYSDTEEIENFPIQATAPVFFKRPSFSHEQEFRIVLRDENLVEGYQSPKEHVSSLMEEAEPGRGLKVDVESLIEEIVISPVAPSWLSRLVKEVTRNNCYQLNLPVRDSEITGVPFWE